MAGDLAIRRMAAAAVLLVAAIAAVISFVHIEHLALTHGQTTLAAYLLPLSIDGTVAAASLVLLRAARAGLTAPRLAQVMLGLAVVATLAANVANGARYGLAGALLSGWPAVAFIGSAEMALGMVRRTRQAAPEDAGAAEHGAPALPAVPAPAPAVSTPGEHLVSTSDHEPLTVPEPQRSPASRQRTRRPVTGEDAEQEFMSELAEGAIPSLRQIRARMHVDQDNAKRLRAHLEAVSGPVGIVE